MSDGIAAGVNWGIYVYVKKYAHFLHRHSRESGNPAISRRSSGSGMDPRFRWDDDQLPASPAADIKRIFVPLL
jgi:hypothetical protein